MSKFVLTAQLQLQAPTNTPQVVSQIRKQLSDVNIQINAVGAARADKDIKKLSASVKSVATNSEKMGKGFAAAVRRFSASAIAYKAVSLLTGTLAEATREAIAFEREMIKISQVTGKTIEQLRFLSSAVSDLSTNLGVSSSSLLSVSRILSQAGFSAEETSIALDTLAKTELAPTFDDIRQTAEGAIAIFNQFGAGAAALEEQLGSINAVAGQFAVEAGDLISVVRRTGGVFKAAGGELNELIALFTSVRSTTRESAESIATGLRTIFTRIQRPKTIEYLKKYGVELTDLEGKFVGPYEAVRRLSQALAGLEEGDITFVQIAEELGGFRQIGKVIPLLQQFSVAQNALNVAQKGSGSLATDAAKAQQALAIQVTKVKQEFLELIRNVTATPTFQIMAKTALTLASALIKVADSLKSILPVMTAIAAVKFTQSVGGFLGGFAGAISSKKGFAKGGKVSFFAEGGSVPGSGTRDSVKAMLTPGEYVLRRSVAKKLGPDILNAINKTGTLPEDEPQYKFATGGLVPGSGNRDTVKAMLTPGEFVLRKDVVNQIGTDKLQELNSGGKAVQKYGGGTGKKGAANKKKSFKAPDEYELTEDVGQLAAYGSKAGSVGNSPSKTETTLSHIVKKNPNSDAAHYVNNEGADPNQKVKVYGNVHNMLLGDESKKSFGASQWLDSGLGQIDKKVNTSLGKLGLGSSKSSLKDDEAVRQKVEGFTLESFISGLLGKAAEGGKEAFDFKGDFSNNLGDQLTMKGMPPRYLDSKRSLVAGASIVKKGIDDADVDVIEKFADGGLVQKFADGGLVKNRKVGYIDYDAIANPANEAVVKQGMGETGVTGPRLYADFLSQLAVKARKSQTLEKLTSIFGVAGSGKTTLAKGQGTDDATLRKTERFPILSPKDIEKATEVIVLSSSVSKSKLDEVFEPSDRTYTLSSTTDAEKARVKSQRLSRDETGVGLEGRKPGTTIKAEDDTAVGEALLADRLGDKSVVLARKESGGVRAKRPEELVEVIKKKIGFTWGGFSPITAGHESIMDAASAMGIPPKDFFYLVGSNEAIKGSDPSSYRTAIFDQDARMLLAQAGPGSAGANVLPKSNSFDVPQAFDVSKGGDKRQVVVPEEGSTAFVADKTAGQTAKYKESGYDVQNLERTGGISGTQVRDLIMKGDMAQLQKVLSPNVYDLISKNIDKIQNRANALPEIIQSVKQKETASLADIQNQIAQLGISRIDNKLVESDQEYAAKVEVLKELRGLRDKIKSAASFEPYSILAAMTKADPDKYGLDLRMSPAKAIPAIRTVTKKTKAAKASKFAIGGVVPGTGNRDTVPATLQAGDFVIRKKSSQEIGGPQGLAEAVKYATGGGVDKSVPALLTPGEIVVPKADAQRIGYNKLNQINKKGAYAFGGTVQKFNAGGEVQKFASGGQIKIKPGEIGGFFLQPEQGTDRDINIPETKALAGNITNVKALERLGLRDKNQREKLPTGETEDDELDAFSQLSANQLKRIVGKGKGGPKVWNRYAGKTGKEALALAKEKQKSSIEQEAAAANSFVGSYNDPAIQREIKKEYVQSKRNVSGRDAKTVGISGTIKSFFPGGANPPENAQFANAVKNKTSEGLKNIVASVAESVNSLLNNGNLGAIKLDSSKVRAGAERASTDQGTLDTTVGYMFEGLIDSLTGAKLRGGKSTWDFNGQSISSNADALARLFADSPASFSSMKKADAKKSANSDSFSSIKEKVINDINSGATRGYEFIPKKFATGGVADAVIKKFAGGGLVPGTGNRDTVPATLEAGDFVIRKSSVKSLGYADGGNVKNPVPALLTPGELVVPKTKAQKIGYGNLNKINKFGKGGFVGRQRLFVGGVADEQASRTEGYVDYTNIEQAGEDFAKILAQLGPELAAKIQAGFQGIQNIKPGESLKVKGVGSSQAFKDASRGMGGGGMVGDELRTAIGLQIQGKSAQANTNTLAHETGHIADLAVGGGSKASQQQGTFQFDLAEKVKPVMEAALKKAGKSAQEIESYLASNSELFAEFFAKASPEVRAIITSTTDSKKGMQELKAHLEAAGHTYAGLEASDITEADTGVKASPSVAPSVSPPPVPASSPAGLIPQASVAATAGAVGGLGYPGAMPTAPEPSSSAKTSEKKTSSDHAAMTKAIAGYSKEIQGAEKKIKSLSTIQSTLEKEITVYKAQIKSAGKNSAEGWKLQGELNKVIASHKATTEAIDKTGQQLAESQKNKAEAIDAARIIKGKDPIGPPGGPPRGGGGGGGGSPPLGPNDPNDPDPNGKVSKSADQAASMFGGVTGALLATQTALAMLTPTIDENSSAFDRGVASLTSSIGGMVGAITLAQTALSTLGVDLSSQVKNFSLGDVTDFLRGGQKGGGPSKIADQARFATRKFARDGAKRLGVGARKLGKIPGLEKAFPTVTRGLTRLGNTLLGGSNKIAGVTSRLVGGFTSLLGPLVAAAGGVKMVGDFFDSLSGRTEALNKAIEEGNIAEAERVAYNKAGAEAVTNLSAGIAGALSVIPGVGPVFGALIGGALKLASELPIIGDGIKAFAGAVSVAFGGKTLNSIAAMAGAQAAAAKATKDLAEGQKVSSKAMEQFKNGTLSASDALSRVQSATASVETQQKKATEAVAKNNQNKSTGALSYGREAMAYLTLGYVDDAATRNKGIDKENRDMIESSMKSSAERFEMTKPLEMAKARAQFASGATIEEVRSSGEESKLREKAVDLRTQAQQAFNRGDAETGDLLAEAAKQAREQADELRDSYVNLQKEVEKSQKYFAAMNLGLTGAQGAAGAFSNAMANYAAAQEAGNVSVMRSFETLQAGVTSAAAGMSPDVFQSALKETSNALRSFGADDAQIKKFEENLSAVNQAQANAQAGLKSFSQQLTDRSTGGMANMTDEEKFTGLFDTIMGSLPANMGDEVKDRLKDMLNGMDIDYTKIAQGDYSQIEDVFKQLGVDTLEQAKKIVEAEQQYQMAIVDAAKKRAAAEDAMTAGIRKGFDLEKESREIIASAGGPAFTPQQQAQLAVDRYNAGVMPGQQQLGGMTAADIQKQQAALKTRQAEIGGNRVRAAGTDDVAKVEQKKLAGESGIKLAQEEANLAKQNQELYNTTKSLIDMKRKEIDIIKAKNKLEQDSFDALMSGDTEGFFDAQATQGAIDAIAGGGNLADFDADTLQKAFNEIKRQAAAGVTEIGGQQIQGSGGLLERAAGATLQARGLDPAQAAMMAQQGTQMSPAEQAANNEIQQLAGTLTGFADMDKQAADLQMKAAEKQMEAATDMKNKAVAQVEANKGKDLSAPAAKAAPAAPAAGVAPAAAQAVSTSAPTTTTGDPIGGGLTTATIATGGTALALARRDRMAAAASFGDDVATASTKGGGKLAAAKGYVADKFGALKQTKAGQLVAEKAGQAKSAISAAKNSQLVQGATQKLSGAKEAIKNIIPTKKIGAEVGEAVAKQTAKKGLLQGASKLATGAGGKLAASGAGQLAKGLLTKGGGLGLSAGIDLLSVGAQNLTAEGREKFDQKMQERSARTDRTMAGGAIEGLLNPVEKIIEGAYTAKDTVKAFSESSQASQKTKDMVAKSVDATGLEVRDRTAAREQVRLQTDLQAAKSSGNVDEQMRIEKQLADNKAAREKRRGSEKGMFDYFSSNADSSEYTDYVNRLMEAQQQQQAQAAQAAQSQGVQADMAGAAGSQGATSELAAGSDLSMEAAKMQMEAARLQLEAAKAGLVGEQDSSKSTGLSMSGDFSGQSQTLEGAASNAMSSISSMISAMNDKSTQRNNTSEIVQAIKQGIQAAAVAPSALRSGVMSVNNNVSRDSRPAEGGMNIDTTAMTQFSTALEKFNDTILKSIETLQNTKFTIQLEPTNININLTGTSFLQSLTSGLKQELLSMISSKFRNLKVDPSGRVVESSSEV